MAAIKHNVEWGIPKMAEDRKLYLKKSQELKRHTLY
jgi:hypothetical protein